MLLALFSTTFLSPSAGSFIHVLVLLVLHTFLAGLDALVTVLNLPFKSLYWSMVFWIALIYGAVVAIPVFVQDMLGCVRGSLVELVVCMIIKLHGEQPQYAATTTRSSPSLSQRSRPGIEETQSNIAQYHSERAPTHHTTRATRANQAHPPTAHKTEVDVHCDIKYPPSLSLAHHSQSNPKPIPPSSGSLLLTNDSKSITQPPQPGLSLLLTRKLGSLLRFAASPIPIRSKSKSRSKCARKIRCRRKTEPPQCLNGLVIGPGGGELRGQGHDHVEVEAGKASQVRDETAKSVAVNRGDESSTRGESSLAHSAKRVIATMKIEQRSKYSCSSSSSIIGEKEALKRREERFRNLAQKLRRLRRLMDDEEY